MRNPELRMTSCRDPAKGYPLILPEDLSSGREYTVFLDEFEKASVTDFTSRMLFELVQGLRDFGHQLIVTSNKDWVGLLDHWSRIDEIYGNSIMTRLHACALIEMF